MNVVRTHERGGSLAEYGLLFGLIAVMGIAATTLLGSSVSDNIEDNANINERGEQLFALLDTVPDAGPRALPDKSALFPLGAVSAGDSPGFGVSGNGTGFTFTPPDSLTLEDVAAGSVTTSANGVELIAAQCQAVAETGLAPDGTPLNPAQRTKVGEMAAAANNIADQIRNLQNMAFNEVPNDWSDPRNGIQQREHMENFIAAQNEFFTAFQTLPNVGGLLSSLELNASYIKKASFDAGNFFNGYLQNSGPQFDLSLIQHADTVPDLQLGYTYQIDVTDDVVQEHADLMTSFDSLTTAGG